MTQTEAQYRASKKYHQKYEYLQARVTPAEKETVTAHAEAMGESLKLLNLDFYVFLLNNTKKTVRGELLWN